MVLEHGVGYDHVLLFHIRIDDVAVLAFALIIEGGADAGLGGIEGVGEADGDFLVGAGIVIGEYFGGIVEVGAAGGVERDGEVVDLDDVFVVGVGDVGVLDADASAVDVLIEGRADVVAGAGGAAAAEVAASEDDTAFGAVVRGGVVADVEGVIGGAEEEVHADGVAEGGVEFAEGELDVALAVASALEVIVVGGGDGAGGSIEVDLGYLGDYAELGGAGAVGGIAVLDGGGEGYDGGGGGLEAFDVGYAVGLGADVLEEELEEGGFANGVVVSECPVLGGRCPGW